MMKTILVSAAVAALYAGSAFAQAVTTPPGAGQTPPLAATPAPVNPAPMTPTPMTPVMPAPAVTSPPALNTLPGAPPVVAFAAPMFLQEQITGEGLATEWIGESVYNSADEELGTIDDLVLDKDGKIIAVVVGVGGFLGIGQKRVAISWTSLQAQITADNDVRLILPVERTALETAPDYVLLTEQPRTDIAPTPVVR